MKRNDRSQPWKRGGRSQAGFSYVEVLTATLLISVALVPAIDALQTGIKGTDVAASRIERHHHLTAKLEEVLSRPFSELQEESVAAAGNPSAYSDATGTADRRQVWLAAYDIDNADGDGDTQTGTDADVLWVRVAIENGMEDLESLTVR